MAHGLEKTMEQLEGEPESFKNQVRDFIYSLVSHYVFDGGKLVVAHAGLKEEMQGRGSGAVRSFCMFGETTGEIDEFGLPVRYNWASEYRGKAMVVYGHTPVPEPQWLNRTIDIDTGCVFGWKLTALRYPEEELVSVQAKQVYEEPKRPLIQEEAVSLSHQQEYDDLLDIEDVTGKRIISTSLRNNVTVREENSVAALEVMSRFAVNPKWLIYLPPTMSPAETSEREDYLEHPDEALKYFRSQGIRKVICEEKHMGSRAVLVVCKDEKAALERYGIEGEGIGICYTRTGRSFFNDANLEQAFLQRISKAMEVSGLWDKLETDWICLDPELMPWSAKAQALLEGQYAAVGASASASLADAVDVLDKARNRGVEGLSSLYEGYKGKQIMVSDFVQAYQHYCWPVKSMEDLKLAPFHILASEGKVYFDQSHQWHMDTLAALCQADPILHQTNHRIVDLEKEDEVQSAVNWWTNLTEKGGEGMVIKPLYFIAKGKKGLVQPAIKCRGREYLRIIYGPEYTAPEHLQRLKNRDLSGKRSLALREFALGLEGLERFIKKEPPSLDPLFQIPTTVNHDTLQA
jgi:protein phosphatase